MTGLIKNSLKQGKEGWKARGSQPLILNRKQRISGNSLIARIEREGWDWWVQLR